MTILWHVLLGVGLLWCLLGTVGFLFNYSLWKKQQSEVSLSKNIFFFFCHGPVLWFGGILLGIFILYFAIGAYILIGGKEESEEEKENTNEIGT